jgi:hypothetical protein
MTKNKVTGKKFDKEMKRLQNDKRAARLNCISHFLSQIPYGKTRFELGPVPERRPRGPNVPDEVTFKHTVPVLF